MTSDSAGLKSWAAVATRIERRIDELKLSQRELVERSGVSSSTWRSLAAGAPVRRNDKVRGICIALGWTPDSIDRILAGEEPNESPGSEPVQIAAKADRLTPEQRKAVESIIDQFLEDK